MFRDQDGYVMYLDYRAVVAESTHGIVGCQEKGIEEKFASSVPDRSNLPVGLTP